MSKAKKINNVHLHPSLAGALLAARKRFRAFTGRNAGKKNIGVLELTKSPDVVFIVGKVEGIIYSTNRDGKPERYVHEFESPRPDFAISSDGRQIYIVSGRYKFTERGIIG